MENHKLFKNTFFYSIGAVLPQIAAFLLLPIYLQYLTPSDYGVLNAVQVISSVLAIIYTLAIDKAIYRLYFDFKSEKSKKDFLGTIFISVLIIVIFITSILFLFPQLLGSIYKNISFYPYISLSCIATFLATFSIIPRSVYFVREQAREYIFMSLSEFFLRNIFVFILVVFLSKGVEGYLYGQIIGSAILAPIFLYITSKQINFIFIKSYIISSLKYSLPMLPTFISVWVITAIDRVFIERYFSAADVGIYSLGYKIAMLVTVITGALYKAYNPYYFKIATTGVKEEVIMQLKKTNTIYVLFVIIITSMMSLFSKEIVYIFFDPEYFKSYKIIVIVSLAFGLSSFSGIFNLAIYQKKKTIFLMYINLIAAFLNIGLNFIFISRFGALGAALATVLTYFIVVIMSYYYAKKCFYASFDSEIIIYSSVLLIFINLFFYYINITFWLSLSLKILCVLIILSIIWFKFRSVIMNVLKK